MKSDLGEKGHISPFDSVLSPSFLPSFRGARRPVHPFRTRHLDMYVAHRVLLNEKERERRTKKEDEEKHEYQKRGTKPTHAKKNNNKNKTGLARARDPE